MPIVSHLYAPGTLRHHPLTVFATDEGIRKLGSVIVGQITVGQVVRPSAHKLRLMH